MPNSLEDRFCQLERQHRTLKRVVVFICAVMSAVLIMGTASPKKVPDEIVAHSIRMVNDLGKNEAGLYATHDGFVGLYCKDLEGRTPVNVLMTPSGKPVIFVSDGKRSRVSLGVVDIENREGYRLSFMIKKAKRSGCRHRGIH